MLPGSRPKRASTPARQLESTTSASAARPATRSRSRADARSATQRLLAAAPHAEGRVRAQRIAPRRLDLDHVGAVVGEDQRGDRAREARAELEHAQAVRDAFARRLGRALRERSQCHGDQRAVRSSLLCQRSRSSSASCIQVPGCLYSGGTSRVSSAFKQTRLHHLLPEHDLASPVAPEGRSEARLDAQQRAAGLAGAGHLRRVVRARSAHVFLEPALEGPDRVLHEQTRLVLRAADRHAGEIDVLQRRPGKRHQQLGRDVVAELVDLPRPGGEVAVRDALGEPLPGGAVADRRERHHLIGRAAAVRVMQEVEQPRVGIPGERRAARRGGTRPRTHPRARRPPRGSRAGRAIASPLGAPGSDLPGSGGVASTAIRRLQLGQDPRAALVERRAGRRARRDPRSPRA